MNILLLTHKLPSPLHDGYNLHNAHYARRLGRDHAIHMVSVGRGALDDDLAACFASVTVVEPPPPSPPPSTVRRVARAFSVDEVFEFDPAVLEAARAVVARADIDVVWTSGAKMLVYSRHLGLPTLGDIADEAAREALHEVRKSRGPVQLARALKNLANTWRYQRKYLEHAAICTVVSDMDREMLARNCPGLRVHVIPNGVDGDHYAPGGEPEQPHSLAFEGAMDFPPNAEGITAFCEDTLPLIRAEVPDVHLNIVGRDPVPGVAALAGEHVTVTGWVDDVRPWVDRSSVFVCPLRRGTGIKNKILQAWALERPVVATPVSCGGLRMTPGENILVAEEPAHFARAVVDLLRDPDRRAELGRAGRATVLEHYSWDAKARELESILAEVAGAGARRPQRV